MSPSRRRFLETSLVANGTVGMGLGWRGLTSHDSQSALVGYRPEPPRVPSQPLKILILGSTDFLGPHHVNYALQQGLATHDG
jgi:hypothetical protein